ncbi:MAG: hypothetical protein QOF70_888 [Acetobacteraceae bacterium]|jgi:hypothetical protein|nr:hypothetical protein [Rhodopila sp.]MEA2726413.1 hypothetical protein [Acetobacteraceae bacterium]
MNRRRLAIPMGLAVRLGRVVPLGLCVLMSAVALSGCAGSPQTGQAAADAETRDACRARAEQAYNQQNRAEIYSPPPTVNTPYSANYVPSMSDRGLSELFVHDRMISDCVRNTGTGTDRNQPPSPPPPSPQH